MSPYFVGLLVALFIQSLAAAQPELTPPGPPVSTPPPNALPPNALPADQPVEEEGVEALTQGPIHEAFADPASPDPEPSPIVSQAPPADVPEQPAAYKPEGDFDWIPGYWDWDDDADRYLWVTGVWRQPPPEMRWVPGYWNEVSGGVQRVKGFWVRDEVENVVYYDQPPASLETGPSSPAPASNYFWIPGSWTNGNTNAGFAWQGGYWAPYQPDWVWTPARWVWTPAGFVYVAGYWDYRMGSRGQIFAPVYFRTALYTQPGWTYRPSIVIPTGNLFIHLWVRPNHGCYYFGNYYGPRYASRGFVSWSNLPSHRHGYHYDPFYSYARVHYRQQGVDYLGRVQGWHNYYAQHPEHRQPPTFREQKAWLGTTAGRAVSVDAQLVARPIAEVARQGDSPMRLARLNEQAIESQAKHAKQIRELDSARRKLEREHAQVSINRPESNGRDLPGRDRDKRDGDKRDGDKAESLVDRAEKGKLDRVPKGGIVKGDQELAREFGKLPRVPAAGETVKGGQTAKIALPKVEMPKASDVATLTPESGERSKSRERTAPPPLPNTGHRPNTGGRQNTTTKLPGNSLPDAGRAPDVGRLPGTGRLPNGGVVRPAPNEGGVGKATPNADVGAKLPDVGAKLPDVGAKLPEAGKSPGRSTFGTKTGEQPRLPTRIDDPRSQPRNAGREGVTELPPSGGQGPVRSGTVPGRSGGEPSRRGFESPGISPPGKTSEQPRATSPGRELPKAGDRLRTVPNSGVREQTIPSNSNRDRGGPRNDQPVSKAPAPKPEAKSSTPSQPSRGSSREDGGGGTTESGKKKKS